MIELKLRAWNRHSKTMLPVRYLRWLANGNIASIGCGDETGFQERLRPRDCVLMRYIERKDKNGREIYEGDVIKYNWFGYARITVVDTLQKALDSDELAYILSRPDVEVFGNIYEHPGLKRVNDYSSSPAPNDEKCRECYVWRMFPEGQEHFGYAWWGVCEYSECKHEHHKGEKWTV